MRPVVKRSFPPTRVEMLPLALRQASSTMLSGRPGPVNVDVPFNLFQEEADVALEPGGRTVLNARRSAADPADIARALDMVLAAERPVLFIGHGVALSEASKELTALARRLSILVISSPNGMGCLDMHDPLSLGFIGRNGAYPANRPYLIDVHVDANVRPPATGAWALPPTPHKEPVFGKRMRADELEATK